MLIGVIGKTLNVTADMTVVYDVASQVMFIRLKTGEHIVVPASNIVSFLV